MSSRSCRSAAALAALLATACGPANDARPPDSNCMGPDLAPTPYRADEIRAGCPAGRRIKFRIEQDGKAPVRQVLLFVGNNEAGSEIRTLMTDDDGKPQGPPSSAAASWSELQAHAAFPAADTTITTQSCTTPVGAHECWHYEVRDEENGKPRSRRFWFAKDRPGPPLRMEVKVGEHRTLRTMIEDKYVR